jgi:hypothetical protein
VFSLLAAAAERIEEGETCVDLNSVGPIISDVYQPHDDQPVEPERPVKNNPGKKKPKSSNGGKWKAWKDRLVGLISEDEDADDEQ